MRLKKQNRFKPLFFRINFEFTKIGTFLSHVFLALSIRFPSLKEGVGKDQYNG